MAICIENIPNPLLKAIGGYLISEGSQGLDPKVAGILWPHKVYSLNKNIFQNVLIGVNDAVYEGWRYIVQPSVSDSNPVGTLSVVCFEQEEWNAEVVFKRNSATAGQMQKALSDGERLPMVKNGLFHPRILRIPDMDMEGLWLTDSHKRANIIRPFQNPPTGLRADIFYYAQDFIASIRNSLR